MSSSLHKHEAPQWKTFWRGFCPGPQTRGSIRGHPPQISLRTPKFVVLRKICFKHMIKNNLSPLKIYFAPKRSNMATGLVVPKLCLQLGCFVLKAIRPRDVA